jgi:predicted dehydrogenase
MDLEACLKRAYSDSLVDARIFHDVDRLLDDGNLDGVLIGTRCALHTPYALKVLERNLPLFLEKPVATS